VFSNTYRFIGTNQCIERHQIKLAVRNYYNPLAVIKEDNRLEEQVIERFRLDFANRAERGSPRGECLSLASISSRPFKS